MKTQTWFVQHCSCGDKEIMKTRRFSCNVVVVEVRNSQKQKFFVYYCNCGDKQTRRASCIIVAVEVRKPDVVRAIL